jgi:hypothetical protein
MKHQLAGHGSVLVEKRCLSLFQSSQQSREHVPHCRWITESNRFCAYSGYHPSSIHQIDL